jgi:hypothetical protein
MKKIFKAIGNGSYAYTKHLIGNLILCVYNLGHVAWHLFHAFTYTKYTDHRTYGYFDYKEPGFEKMFDPMDDDQD